MGAGQSTSLRLIDDDVELLRETRDFARWALADVTQLHKRFQRTHGFAITEGQFENLLLLKASETVSSKETFSVLDTNRDGRIDGLEFLAALLCVCRASFEEKARFAFELFDFNLNGSLSVTELALLMKSVWVGMSLLTGHAASSTPSALAVSRFLQLAQLAFARFDRDGADSLQYEEFIDWARSNREFMLQVEQFRVISEKAVGFEETLSLPDGSDVDSDLEEEVAAAQITAPFPNEAKKIDLASAPWHIEPTFAFAAVDPDFPPPINVNLEWIYGYPSTTARDALRILSNGDVVYTVSKYAIVYTPERHQQRYYLGHKSPITSLDVNATSTIVATGDAAVPGSPHAEIHVWNGLSLECLAVLSSFHTDSIACLRFPGPMSVHTATPLTTTTASGKNASVAGAVNSAKKQHHAADTLLLSIGSDVNASMALWDWHNARLLASGRAIGKRKRVLCVAVSEDGTEILVAGEHFLVFHHVDGRFFKMKRPKQLEAKMQTMPLCLSAAYQGIHTAVVGTARGELLQFHHGQLVRVVQAHDPRQSINFCSLSCRSMVLFTAGKDGMIKQWDSTLQPIGNVVDLHQLSHVKGLEHEDFRVHSLAYDASLQRFFVGTRHGHLIMLDEATHGAKVVGSSHYGADVDGLATCRFGVCFSSCSTADRTVRVWNMRRRVEQHAIKLRFPPSACVYSRADGGEFLAVGGSDGTIALFRSKAMALLNQVKNTQSAVTCMRFHPSQATLLLAVACVNGLVYLYSIEDDTYRFHRFALLKPSPGEAALRVSSLDFSTDGRFLKTQHGDTTLRFWSVRVPSQSASRVTSMPAIRNVVWQSYTSVVGWHVSGLYDPTTAALAANTEASVAATLDTRGQLVFRHFPCDSSQRSLSIVVSNAHLNGATSAALGFALHDTLLLTTSSSLGSNGSVVCQWSVMKELVDPQPRHTAPLASDAMWYCLQQLGLENLYFFDDSYVPRANGPSIDAVLPPTSAPGSNDLLFLPSVRDRSEAPDLDLALVFVVGFNHKQSGVNQILTGMSGSRTTSLVYGAGTTLVALVLTATQAKQQRVLVSGLHHDITSVVKQSNSVLAIGSRRESRVLVWQWEPSVHLMGFLAGPRLSCHVLTAFDDSSELCGDSHHHHHQSPLAAVVWYEPTRKTHVIRFYNWKKAHHEHTVDAQDQPIQADMTRLPVLFGLFVPPLASSDSNTSNAVGFVSGGVDHVSFWSFNVSTGHVVSQSGVFGRHALVETALCGAYAAPYVITGMVSGVLVVWDNGIAAFSLPALDSAPRDSKNTAVTTLSVIPTKQQLVVALRNGHIGLFSYAKESDPSRCRANAFLQRVRVVNVFDDVCTWRFPSPTAKPTTENDAKQAASRAGAVLQSVTVLDELQGGLAVVLSCGAVLQVDNLALTGSGSFLATGVLDVGEQISSIDVHPTDRSVALGNSDGGVCVYHLDTHALMAQTTLPDAVKAMAWASTNKLAISLSSGMILVLGGSNLATETQFPCGPAARVSQGLKKWCWAMRFSRDAAWLAVACRDYHVYVYKCSSSDGGAIGCELAHDFAGHTAPVSSLDFSLDSQWLQSATASVDSQLLRWPLAAQPDAKAVVESRAWASWTVAFSGPVAGLTEAFGTDVSAVDRIQSESTDSLWASRLPTVAIGTETGRVLLGWYPLRCGESGTAMFKEYDGYYATRALVAQTAFSAANEFVVTRAKSDFGSADGGVVLVWKTDYDDEIRQLERASATATAAAAAAAAAAAPAAVETVDVDEEEHQTTVALLSKDDARFSAAVGGGDEFMAVKPWLGAIREPSVLSPGTCTSISSPPTADLALEFVYGVNSNATNTKRDVFYADDSWEIVYSAASFGVVYNTKTHTQLLNATHSGQMISCVAVHPGRGDIVVTGEIAGGKKKPRLVAWDANSGSTIAQIDSVHARGVALLAFAPSGDRVASVGMDDDHVLAIYAIAQSLGLARFKLLAHMKTSKQPVYALAFHHDSDTELVTAGLKHVLFWSAGADNSTSASHSTQRHRGGGAASTSAKNGALTLSMKKGLFGTAPNSASAKTLAAVFVPHAQLQSHVVTGQHDGSLYVWRARQFVECKAKAHAGPVYVLVVDRKKPGAVYSAGHDGKIALWNAQLEQLAAIDLGAQASAVATPLVSTAVMGLSVRESRILFATDGGDVGELVPEEAKGSATSGGYKVQIHLRSHSKGELWGLAAHPTKMQFASAGDDGSVRLWDAPTRSLLALYRQSSTHKWRALAYSSDGSHVCAGSADGHVLVLSEALDTVVTSWKCCPKAIAVVKYAPENSVLAVGTHDQSVYVYDGHTYKPLGTCRGHSSTVTHLDFSADGRVMQTTSSAGELLFWDVRTLTQITSATSVRDTPWASWTLPFGWPVQGIWPPCSDGSDVNAVARSQDRRVLATGDDDGLLKLFMYPCVKQHAEFKAFAGHASHVTNCCFTRDDFYLLSAGGLDNTVCQYKYYANNVPTSGA